MTNHINGMKEKQNVGTEANRVAAEVEDKATNLATQARDQAADLAHQAQAEAKHKLDEQKANAAAQLQDIAKAIHQTGDQISQQNPTLAHYTRRLADQMESASSYLSDQELKDILNDVQSFARQRPEVFIGGAFALGVVIARFLKSSNSQTNTMNEPQPSYLPTYYPQTSPSYNVYRRDVSRDVTSRTRENMRDYS